MVLALYGGLGFPISNWLLISKSVVWCDTQACHGRSFWGRLTNPNIHTGNRDHLVTLQQEGTPIQIPTYVWVKKIGGK